MEQVDNGFTLEVTKATFLTDSEVVLIVKSLGSDDPWELINRSFASAQMANRKCLTHFEMGHPDIKNINDPKEKMMRLFVVDENRVCFALNEINPTDVKDTLTLQGHVTGPFGSMLKDALVNQNAPVYFGTRTVNVQESHILGLDWIQTTKRKYQNVDSIVDAAMKKMAYTVKPPKSNWVIYNAVTGKFLGRIPNPEAEIYPLPGESETVFGWVDDVQKAKANWIIKPPVTLLRFMHGLNFDNCFIRKVNVADGVITLE